MFPDPIFAKHLKEEEEGLRHGPISGKTSPKFNQIKLIK